MKKNDSKTSVNMRQFFLSKYFYIHYWLNLDMEPMDPGNNYTATF